MKQWVAVAAAGVVLGSTLVACDTSSDQPDPAQPSASSHTSAPPAEVQQHETLSGNPIAFGLSVPDGATQLGPLVRRRSPALVAAYADILATAERLDQIKKLQQAEADAAAGKTAPTPAAPANPLPTRDTYSLLDNPPPPDVTTSLMRVDSSPSKVFKALLTQVDKTLPDLGVDPAAWSQYCTASEGLYTGCSASFAGRTDNGDGVRIELTVDPGDVQSLTAPAGSDLQPVVTVTTVDTDPPDTTKALDDLATPVTPTPSTVPPPPVTPVTQGPPVAASWPTMTSVAPSASGDRLLPSTTWIMRSDTIMLLSGDTPAFAMTVVNRSANADAVARSYVLPYSTGGAPTQNVVEDRNEISTTYTSVGAKSAPRVRVTYVQSGRGNYVALSFTAAS